MSSLDLDRAEQLFAEASDLTVGVEEEFAILDAERLNMTAGPLTDSIWSFLASRPAYHGKPVPFAIKAYLKEACS